MFAEWAAFTVEDVQGFALAATGAPRTAGGYIMVQHVIDSLLVQQTPTWMESAELAMNFTLAGDEQPHSVTKVWLPLAWNRLRTFLCLRGPERSDPDFVRTRHDPGVSSLDRCFTFTILDFSVESP